MPLLLAFLINSSSPLSNTLFFSGSFKDFFSSWIMSTDFFGFTLFEVCWASWSLWKLFSCYFFKYFSVLHSFSSSGTSVNCILDFWRVPSIPGGFPGGWVIKTLPAMQETQIRSLAQEDPLEEGMAVHSRTLAWESPWTEEPAGCIPWAHAELDATVATRPQQHPSLMRGSRLFFSLLPSCLDYIISVDSYSSSLTPSSLISILLLDPSSKFSYVSYFSFHFSSFLSSLYLLILC